MGKRAPFWPCKTTWLPLPLDLLLADFSGGIFVIRLITFITSSSLYTPSRWMSWMTCGLLSPCDCRVVSCSLEVCDCFAD